MIKVAGKIIVLVREFITNKSIKNGFIFAFFSILNNGLNFLLLFVLAKFLFPDEYGSLSLYNNFTSIIIILSTLGSVGYVSVAYYKEKKDEFKYYITAILSVLVITLIFLSTILFIFSLFNIVNIGIDYKYQILGVTYCFFQFFIVLILEIWRLKEKPYKYGLFTSTVAILNFSLTFYLLNLSFGWLSRLYAQVIVTTIIALLSVIILIKKQIIYFKLPSKKFYIVILNFGLPIVPHLMTVWLRQGLDSYIINYYYTTKEVGIYFFALNFSNLIYVLGSAFNSSNSIEIYKMLSKGYSYETKLALKKQNVFISTLFIVITLFVVFASFLLIPSIFPQYIGSRIYILPLCIGGFFQIVYLMYVNILFYYSKTKNLMFITLSLSVLYAILSLIITKYSLFYLSLTAMIINISIAIIVTCYSYIELNKHYS